MKKKRVNLMQILQTTLLFVFMLLAPAVSAQVTIGAGTPPKATLEVVGDTGIDTPVGVIAPRVALSYLNLKAANYTVEQKGAIVYVLDIDEVGVGPTSEVEGVGYYYYTGDRWLRFVVPDAVVIPTEPLRVIGTGGEATGNTENVYQNSQVVIGKDMSDKSVDVTAQVEISSNDKGFLLPRLSKIQRDLIKNPTESLLIWNTDEGCFNFWKANKWKSMCGGMGDAEVQISPLDCASGVVKGAYQVGKAITGGEYIEITLEVLEPGAYTIEAAPSDQITGVNDNYGFFFQRSGTFSVAGKYTVQIPALGTPLKDGIFDLELKLNGVPFSPGCSKTVEVDPADAKFYFVGPCGQKAADKLKRGDASTGKTIEVNVFVVNAGTFSFSTNTMYGVNYSASGISLAAGSQTVTLSANGQAPSGAGNDVVFKVSGTGNDISKSAGTGTSECEVLVDIEESFADVTVDKSTIKVYGTYIINSETAAGGNYIELSVTTTTTGFWDGIAECAGSGFTFKGEGMFLTGDTGSTPKSIKLYSEGVALVSGPQDFMLKINGGEEISVRVNVAYREIKVAGFGATDYQPYGAPANRSSRVILESEANFGLTGTWPTLGVKIVGGSTSSSSGGIATYLASNNPDIIVIGYNYHTNAADNTALKNFLENKKGVVLMMSQDNRSADERLINAITGGSVTMGAGNLPGHFVGLNGTDHPILNGPFGDIRNKHWGEDVGTTHRLTSALPTGMKSLGADNEIVVYNQFVWIGDGGFLSGTRDNTVNSGSGIWGCITDSNGRPVAKQYGSYGLVYNSQFYANFMAWAIDYVQKNKTN